MNKVKEICIRKGIVQKELATLVGVSQPTVSDWFNNKKDPSGERLEKLSSVLQVSRSVILGLDDEPKPMETQKEAPAQTLDDLILARAREMNKEELQDLLSKIIKIAMEKGDSSTGGF